MVKKIIFAIMFFVLAQNVFAREESDMLAIPLGDKTVMAITDINGAVNKDLIPNINQYPELEAVFERGPIQGITRTYYYENRDRKILFDGGWGSEGKQRGQTLEILKDAGVNPDDITDIVMTHLDFDHIGGLIANGKPVYKNARLWVSRPEYDGWNDPAFSGRGPESVSFARNVTNAYKDNLKLFNYGDEILPGIIALDAAGHTPGHTVYQIKNGDDSLLIIGDLIHVYPVQLPRPDISSIYDMNPQKAAESRKNILKKASEEKDIAAGMHIPMISPVIARQDGGFAMREPR